ncbi:Rho_N domain-containing protein [Cephalotus follicularis]|uniref:Rho_N domain-containing protein n=1 Tax=Cephalotus follicularis TaxID=3775 RepID=A0A1Q3CTV9_CEPFO|nr:Rho_N domain-containing protein [Cephalotus follicularis]
MSQAVDVIARNLPGYGPSKGSCLPCSGISSRAVSVSFCSSHGDYRICSQVKIGLLKCASRGASFVCKANSSGPRRNPDFPRQNKNGFSRGRNRQNEEKDSFVNLDDSELLSSKNGPILSLSSTPKYQATAVPGPREKEIVELFRKVQAQLRERASVKEDKKIEALQGKGKESETVDSLLKLLRKHSVEQGKRKGSSVSNGDFNLDQPVQNGPFYEEKSSSILGSSGRVRDAQEPNAPSLTRPPSDFRRKSPVPNVKYQPVYPGEDTVNSVSYLNSSEKRKKNQVKILPDPVAELVSEPEPMVEPELMFKTEPIIADEDVFGDGADDESSDIDDSLSDEDVNKQELIQDKDLSALKLTELKALAKSRGLKGFSKKKKGELVELLSGSPI